MSLIYNDNLKVRSGVVEHVRGGVELPSRYVDLTVQGNHNFFASPTVEGDMALVHNCHGAPALASSKVLSSLAPKWCLGLSGTPERKCFHPSTLVETLSGPTDIPLVYDGTVIHSPLGGTDVVDASFSRMYSGEMIRLQTEGGKHLMVTPDHLILTSVGWVEAQHLTEEHSVLVDSSPPTPSEIRG